MTLSKVNAIPCAASRVAPRADRVVLHAGRHHYFCSQRCVEKFSQNRAQFLARDLVPPTPTADVTYPCPMHPQVRATRAGDCPLCGMRLEPLLATPNATKDDGELRDLTHRMEVSLALAVPLMVIPMGESLPWLNLQHRLGENLFNWLQLSLATPVVLWGGWPFFVRAWVSFKTWRLNMFSLATACAGAPACSRLSRAKRCAFCWIARRRYEADLLLRR